MQSYNNMVHTSIKMTPNEAIRGTNSEVVSQIKENLYGLTSWFNWAQDEDKIADKKVKDHCIRGRRQS